MINNIHTKSNYDSIKFSLNFEEINTGVATKPSKTWLYVMSLSTASIGVVVGLVFGLVFGLQQNKAPDAYDYAKLIDRNVIEEKHYSIEESPVALKQEGLYDLTDIKSFSSSISVLLKSNKDIENFISTYNISSSQYTETLLSYDESNFATKSLLAIISYDRPNETVYADDILLIYRVSTHLPYSMFITMMRTEDTSNESIYTFLAEVDSETVNTIDDAVYAFNVH